MTQVLHIHPVNPQLRLIRQAVEILNQGELLIYPTDSCYAIGCLIGNKNAMEKIRHIRRLDNRHNFTLMCRDLSDISYYAKVNNSAYRMLKHMTPGPYTFLLKATHEVPRRLQNPKRKTIGLRIPDHAVTRHLLEELDQPLMSSTLILPDDSLPMNDIDEIYDKLKHQVGLIIDGGNCGIEPTTVIDLVDDTPVIVREGKGEVAELQ
jgi:tRNA threonylcarbamoyl adenosine modification protein (Sua5/YciO/YrdC/YwlC family)